MCLWTDYWCLFGTFERWQKKEQPNNSAIPRKREWCTCRPFWSGELLRGSWFMPRQGYSFALWREPLRLRLQLRVPDRLRIPRMPITIRLAKGRAASLFSSINWQGVSHCFVVESNICQKICKNFHSCFYRTMPRNATILLIKYIFHLVVPAQPVNLLIFLLNYFLVASKPRYNPPHSAVRMTGVNVYCECQLTAITFEVRAHCAPC